MYSLINNLHLNNYILITERLTLYIGQCADRSYLYVPELMDQNSSYCKVYVALTKTTTYRTLVDDIREGLESAMIDAVDFEAVTKEGESFAIVYPVFRIKYGKIGGEYPWKYCPPHQDEKSWSITNNKLWDYKKTSLILDNHFGPDKDVKTRNCKRKTLDSGDYGRSLDSFVDWVGHRLTEEFRDLIQITLKRLRSDCLRILKTDEYAKSKEEATIRFCKNAISSVMMRWRHMPDSVLREAWDQFITTAVMED